MSKIPKQSLIRFEPRENFVTHSPPKTEPFSPQSIIKDLSLVNTTAAESTLDQTRPQSVRFPEKESDMVTVHTVENWKRYNLLNKDTIDEPLDHLFQHNKKCCVCQLI